MYAITLISENIDIATRIAKTGTKTAADFLTSRQ
ncbi:CLUMA_CG012632, isoform A [Clunio marinus]|uniref:CLUMA_CG012632, isoform A n=1 Tax=Clunio marinus TaxID=568069 RepID=A0A1J1IG48_9DIPT|nr:CLUMA_CG012632, isoform A [Clunio marinus]